jgi:hypothetical protein
MSQFDEPLRLSAALTELIALRGYARIEEYKQFRRAWAAVAGKEYLQQTKVSRVLRGQLVVEVENAPLLSELSGFHAAGLLSRLQTEFSELKIKGLKFRLKGLA